MARAGVGVVGLLLWIVLPTTVWCNIEKDLEFNVDQKTKHTRNKAVLVSSSRYWFNYRHVSNVLLMYHFLRTSGRFRDEDIVLMVADDIPCNARNPFKNSIYVGSGRSQQRLFYGDGDVEIDYRGDEVTVEAFARVLLGRSSSPLATGEDTNVLVYLTGHGGDGFFKFQDHEELTTQELHSIFQQMHTLGRYNELLFIADTCQAFSLSPNNALSQPEEFVPNMFAIGSSLQGQNSYAHHGDFAIGMSIVDRYTYTLTNLLKAASEETSQPSFQWGFSRSLQGALVDAVLARGGLGANVGFSDLGAGRQLRQVPICDFFCRREDVLGWMLSHGTNSNVPSAEQWEFFSLSNSALSLAWLQHHQHESSTSNPATEIPGSTVATDPNQPRQEEPPIDGWVQRSLRAEWMQWSSLRFQYGSDGLDILFVSSAAVLLAGGLLTFLGM